MSDLIKKKTRSSNLLSYISHTGSRVGFFFICMFTFISGLGMLVNIIDDNRNNSIYNVKFSYNDDLFKAIDMEKNDYYSALFMFANAKNNDIEFSQQDIDDHIRKLPAFQDANGVFSQELLNTYLKKVSLDNLRHNVHIKMCANIMQELVNKLNDLDIENNISNTIPVSMNVSFYYWKHPLNVEDNSSYVTYMQKKLVDQTSVLLFEPEQRAGHVFEIDISQKQIVEELLSEYKKQHIREDMDVYLSKNLVKHCKKHTFDNLLSPEAGFLSDLLFTDDRCLVETPYRIYVPVTKKARSPRIKEKLGAQEQQFMQNRVAASMRSDQLILHLNDLLNRYNNGEIDKQYIQENCNSYSVNIKTADIESLMKLKMLFGAKTGDVFIIDSHEAGNDIPCLAVVNSMEYADNQAAMEMVKHLIKSSYLIRTSALKFLHKE